MCVVDGLSMLVLEGAVFERSEESSKEVAVDSSYRPRDSTTPSPSCCQPTAPLLRY